MLIAALRTIMDELALLGRLSDVGNRSKGIAANVNTSIDGLSRAFLPEIPHQ
jgi:hypothetical protein